MRQLKELLFKKTQELKVQSEKEKIVLAEIEGGQKSLKNLKSRLRKLDTELLKQQELIYSQVKGYCIVTLWLFLESTDSTLLKFCNL